MIGHHQNSIVRFKASVHDPQITVRVRDLSQPQQLYVPKYGGQIYIFVALACGCLAVAGALVMMAAWAVIIWNARVSSGAPTPWWAYSLNRGW
jgi:hypothetical protein